MNEIVSSVIAFAIGGIAYVVLIVILKNKRKRRTTTEIIEEMWAKMNKQDQGGKEMSLKQIRKDLEHRHELYKIMLEAYPDPNNKHAIDLIARMREVTSLIKYIDSLTDEQHQGTDTPRD